MLAVFANKYSGIFVHPLSFMNILYQFLLCVFITKHVHLHYVNVANLINWLGATYQFQLLEEE